MVAEVNSNVGALLMAKRASTLYSYLFVLLSLICFVLAIFLIMGNGNHDFLSAIVWFALGALLFLLFLRVFLRRLECYELGVVVRIWGKGRLVLFHDIVAVRYVSHTKHINGIHQGTICLLQITPRIADSLYFKLFGIVSDGREVWDIVQIILKSNPEVKLLTY